MACPYRDGTAPCPCVGAACLLQAGFAPSISRHMVRHLADKFAATTYPFLDRLREPAQRARFVLGRISAFILRSRSAMTFITWRAKNGPCDTMY